MSLGKDLDYAHTRRTADRVGSWAAQLVEHAENMEATIDMVAEYDGFRVVANTDGSEFEPVPVEEFHDTLDGYQTDLTLACTRCHQLIQRIHSEIDTLIEARRAEGERE